MRAILFDIDGVLIDSKKANFEFHKKQIFDIGGRIITREEYEPLFGTPMSKVVKLFYPKLNREQINKICHQGVQDYPKFYRFIKLEKYVVEILKELKKKYSLGIVTSRITAEVLDYFKLTNYFKVIVTAQDYTHPKPHPEPLLTAVERLNVTPKETIYIGDSKSDEEAAKNAKVVFIAYKNKSLNTPYHITDFKQLPKMLISLKYFCS